MDLESKGVNILHTSYFVCELHFADSDCPKKYLRGDAVPTLLLPQIQGTFGPSKFTQTECIYMSCCSCKLEKYAEYPCTSESSELVQSTKMLSEDTNQKKILLLEIQSESNKRRLLTENKKVK